MAALFKTGEELRKQRMQELAQAQLKGTSEPNALRSGVVDIGKAIGSALGAGLIGKFGPEATPAAGDVDISGVDLGTAKGNFDAAKAMREAGFEAEAQQLEDRGIKLHKYEASVVAEQAALDLEDVPEPTDNQLQGINNYWMLRTDATGELANQIMEESADNPVAAAGLKHMNRLIAVNTNEMVRDLTKTYGKRVPRTMIERAMVDTMAKGGVLGEEGFLFWKDPVVDVKKAEAVMQKVRGQVMDMFTKETPEDAPVETAPAQQTTEMQPSPAVPAGPEKEAPFDVQGSVPAEEMPTATPLEDPLPATRLDAANEIKSIDAELKRVSSMPGSKATAKTIVELQKRRKQLIQQLSQLR